MQNIPALESLQHKLSNIQNLEFIKGGGFKAVYKGFVGGKTEAIKLIYIPSDIENEGLRDEIIGRTLREIDSIKACDCDYIVRLGSLSPELITLNGNEYIVYSEEFLDGVDLRERIIQGHTPDIKTLQCLAFTLFEAISFFKKNDLIHRDIKPDNVIALQCAERPFVILDLGIAFKLHGTALTRLSEFRPGTLPYMAPEMFNARFRETLDYRSDLYSAGVTLYEYASGKHPITRRRDDEYTTMYRIINSAPIPLASHRPDLPIEFCKVIDQLIKKLPALRPSSIEMLLKKIKEQP